jgi:hypothetical protein
MIVDENTLYFCIIRFWNIKMRVDKREMISSNILLEVSDEVLMGDRIDRRDHL